MNQKLNDMANIGLSLLIIADLILLTFTLIFDVSLHTYQIIIAFDTILCVILLIEFFYRMSNAEDKRDFIAKNWTELIAAIPFDLLMLPFVLNYTRFLRLLRILRFIKVVALFSQFFETIGVFLKKTYLDEVLGMALLVIIFSSLALYMFDPSINNLFNSLWFVIATITTVGYGDVVPNTTIGKTIGLFILIVGVLIFSAISGAMASYFTRKIYHREGIYDMINNDDLKEELNNTKEELKNVKIELEENKQLTQELKEEIAILNENLKKE